MLIEVGSTPRRQCPECLVRCHIRCNKCPSCHAIFPPSKKKLALGPPKKYPSNLLAQLHKKANQLHQVGYDVVILTHKSNPTLHTFQRIATPGAAIRFNVKYDKVYQLWKTYMSVNEKGESQGGAELSEIGEGCCSDLPSQPAERDSDDIVSPEMEGIDLPSQPAERGSDDIVSPWPDTDLPSQPAERGSDDIVSPDADLPTQPAKRGSNEVVSPVPSQPAERGSDKVVSPDADLPSQPAGNDVVSPEMEGTDLPIEHGGDKVESEQLLNVGDTKRCGNKQPAKPKGTQQSAENQDLSQTKKQSVGRKSRKRRHCGDCINCKKAKCQKCLPCQNPKWKKPCKERKCLQLLNI